MKPFTTEEYNKYFKDELSKYVFALNHTDATTRMEILKITEVLYYSKEKATEWYNYIMNILEPFKDRNDVMKATINLSILYNRMVRNL